MHALLIVVKTSVSYAIPFLDFCKIILPASFGKIPRVARATFIKLKLMYLTKKKSLQYKSLIFISVWVMVM